MKPCPLWHITCGSDGHGTMTRAVIFDIDGTLVDSVDLHAQSWRAAFEHFGKRVSFADVRCQIGKGADQLMPVFLSPQELSSFGEELDRYRSQLYKREFLPRVKAFAKVRELFQRIRRDGKRIVLASSAKGDELKTYKEITRIGDLIESETSSEDAERSKPYPDIFAAALDELGNIEPEQAIVVGDTPYDAEAAHRAGLSTISLLCGGWTQEALQKSGCIAIYRDPADLLARYEDSSLSESGSRS
jgi:HAD superfamily hydrolase (TIGR01549 family)